MMPESAFKGNKSRDSWTQDIIKEFEKMEFNKGKKTAQKVKTHISKEFLKKSHSL